MMEQLLYSELFMPISCTTTSSRSRCSKVTELVVSKQIRSQMVLKEYSFQNDCLQLLYISKWYKQKYVTLLLFWL